MILHYHYTVRAHRLVGPWGDLPPPKDTTTHAAKAAEIAFSYVKGFTPTKRDFNPRRLLVTTEQQLREVAAKAALDLLRKPVTEAATTLARKGSGNVLRRSNNALLALAKTTAHEYINVKVATTLWGQALGTRITLAQEGAALAREEVKTSSDIKSQTNLLVAGTRRLHATIHDSYAALMPTPNATINSSPILPILLEPDLQNIVYLADPVNFASERTTSLELRGRDRTRIFRGSTRVPR